MADTSYRADQVGSLLRPQYLLDARANQVDTVELREAEDRAILDALERQRVLGLDVVVDGEFRRASWQTDMADAVDGFVSERVTMEWHGAGDVVEGSSAQVVGGSLRQVRRLAQHETTFLRQHAPRPVQSHRSEPFGLHDHELQDGRHGPVLPDA